MSKYMCKYMCKYMAVYFFFLMKKSIPCRMAPRRLRMYKKQKFKSTKIAKYELCSLYKY